MPPRSLPASPRPVRFKSGSGYIALLLYSFFIADVLPQDKAVAYEFDPGIIFRIDPGGRFTYDVYTERDKSEDVEAGAWKIGGGASFRVKPIFKTFLDDLDTDKSHLLVMRLGYEYERASEAEETKITNTIMTDVTPRYRFRGKVLMSNRSRFELRWIDGEPSFRYRNRLRFERPVSLIKKRFEPYVVGEAFWDSRFRSWNKFRYGAGVEFRLFRLPILGRNALDLFYERERCTTCPDPHTNIFGAKLNVFIKSRK